MPILTIEAIRENPWNAITHSLPARPTRFLLELAHLAADYCRASESLLMMAARERDYMPPGWEPVDGCPDIHEEHEARSDEADRRLKEICSFIESGFE